MNTWLELEIRDASGGLRRERVDGNDPIVVGRSADCRLALQDATVSSRHAELRVRDGRVEARDLASRWGTFVGGERVNDWTVVVDGTSIWLGDIEIVPRALPEILPAILRVVRGSAVAQFALLGAESDRLDAAELPPERYPDLGDRLPLRPVRRDGAVVGLEDAHGGWIQLPATVGSTRLELAGDEDSLASVVVSRPGDEGGRAATSGVPDGDAAASEDPRPPRSAIIERGRATPGRATAAPQAGTRRPVRAPGRLRVALLVLAVSGFAFGSIVLWSIR